MAFWTEREPTERVNIIIVVKREKERHDKRMTEEKRREIERIREKDVRRERDRDSLRETLPCVPSKRPCHTRHGRFDDTHGSVLNVHTALFSVQERNAHTHSTSRYNTTTHNNTQQHTTTEQHPHNTQER